MKKVIFLASFFLFNLSITPQLLIYDFYDKDWPDLREHNLYRRSEYHSYMLLKKWNPEKIINYLAVPWNSISYKSAKDRLATLKIKDGFTVMAVDAYEQYIPLLKQIGVNVIFAECATKKTFDGIKIYPMPFIAVNAPEKVKIKDILYSFVGSATHKSRKEIFSIRHPLSAIIIKRPKFHFANSFKDQEKYEQEYKNILARSRYSLCPRGVGAGSFRFWESLKAGAIPVLISDAYLLPFNFDWHKCIIKVKENNIKNIPSIISKIPKEQEEKMRKMCYVAYQNFSGENLIKIIKNVYGEY